MAAMNRVKQCKHYPKKSELRTPTDDDDSIKKYIIKAIVVVNWYVYSIFTIFIFIAYWNVKFVLILFREFDLPRHLARDRRCSTTRRSVCRYEWLLA